MVGDVGVGGDNPIRVQSMTTTLTRDIEATVAQTERLVAAGCEIVRITTPTPADARCLGPIKERLGERGIHVPIVADIHFNPLAALAAAEFADKVRVNPGNYTDSRKFAVREYTDAEYEAELARVEERFTPLVLKCKERDIAMRIGTNHGSLSDRIMNRFGDTPQGMVESALEFVRICEKHDYRNIILSMKASNPKVMIAAYRLLASRMDAVGMDYPFHLGVTEAGNGEDGRIKSAIGIGSLLEDGIGDTIRVSLTEEPEAEIPVAFAIAERYSERRPQKAIGHLPPPPWDPFQYERRPSRPVMIGGTPLGGGEPVAVMTEIAHPGAAPEEGVPIPMARILRWASPAGKRQPKPELARLQVATVDDVAAVERFVARLRKWPGAKLDLVAAGPRALDVLDVVAGVILAPEDVDDAVLGRASAAGKALVLEASVPRSDRRADAIEALLSTTERARARGIFPVLSVDAPAQETIHAYRLLAVRVSQVGIDAPLLLRVRGGEDPLLTSAIHLGALLCDGLGDAVCIAGPQDATELSFNILQAAGTRVFKTDYVACPSCGRTLFDLQETTERIKSRTSHLVGVRLAIMGCIVNGPGEMADADFGYVGGAPGQVNLYVGKECVEKGVPAAEADDRLVDLIKSHGKWEDPD